MTTNQIEYLKVKESRRHNVATEDVSRRNLDEAVRHNLVSEYNDIYKSNMSYAGTKYSADMHYAGQVYAADTSSAATRYSADTAAAASRYNADRHLEGTKYSADRSYAASVYGSNLSYAAKIYDTNTRYSSAIQVAQLQADTSTANSMREYQASLHATNTKAFSDKQSRATIQRGQDINQRVAIVGQNKQFFASMFNTVQDYMTGSMNAGSRVFSSLTRFIPK
nr:putative ORF1 [Marmot picobirnavirus]